MFGSDGIPDWGIACEPGGFDRALEFVWWLRSWPPSLCRPQVQAWRRRPNNPSGVPDQQERIG